VFFWVVRPFSLIGLTDFSEEPLASIFSVDLINFWKNVVKNKKNT
jgi:hypothetical protein